ncbi:carbohydrate porin, partial [Desulfoprunum benzoelyticum]|uniref:carbohydrate porin n=1 Tax=Desulfoprunum benzoelyticum TaxID=1506996 RepID=UPI001962562E
VPYLRERFDLGLDHEDAIEVFYNVAVTPWLSVSPNFQFISPALDRTLDSSGNFKNLDDIYMAGVRIGVRF